MRSRTFKTAAVLGLALSLMGSAVAVGHPGHPHTADEGLVGEGGFLPFQHADQHGSGEGHLPATSTNVELVGKLDLFGANEQAGRVADVAAYGNFAYLGSFRSPTCVNGGVYVVDISNPAEPTQAGFIPTTDGSYVGEGVQVLDVDTAFFKGQILIHNNETCPGSSTGLGGVSMWDVTNPRSPRPLALHFGDREGTGTAHQVHSAFGWTDGNKAYVVAQDNAELGTGDVDIFDITNPTTPIPIAETGLATGFSQARQTANRPNGDVVLHHDMIVKEVDGRMLLLASYWDAGYIILDVDDPSEPTYLRDTNYAAREPFWKRLGLPADRTPEGNGHQAEFSHDGRFFIGTDEDFGPHRFETRITSGPHAGSDFIAIPGTEVPPVQEGLPIEGQSRYVGRACTADSVPAADGAPIAIVERGDCAFTVKVQNVQARGYQAGIVFNIGTVGSVPPPTAAPCESYVSMLVQGNIPFLFVNRSTGFQILGENAGPLGVCFTNVSTPVGNLVSSIRLQSLFDGWGYAHLFDTQTMQDLGRYAIPESLTHPDSLPAQCAPRCGDLTVHEVAMDPNQNLAYFSWYAGGFRVARFGPRGLKEVGHFIDEGGNNFWGVEHHTLPGGQDVVLASDRDSGLYIFRFRRGA